MSRFYRLAVAVAVLPLVAAAAADLSPPAPGRVSADLDARIARADEVGRQKARIVTELAAGRVPLPVAAARFRALDAGFSFRGFDLEEATGATEAERYCRMLIGRAEAVLPAEAKGPVLARLSDELAGVAAAGGRLLPADPAD